MYDATTFVLSATLGKHKTDMAEMGMEHTRKYYTCASQTAYLYTYQRTKILVHEPYVLYAATMFRKYVYSPESRRQLG